MPNLVDELQGLESAEEFLEYFSISYDIDVVKVNRLHILQRFHDYLSEIDGKSITSQNKQKMLYRGLLDRAYADFVKSDAKTEKVFKVFRRQDPREVFIPIKKIGR